MNILILTCNTGAGHNAAASAVREEFERHGDRCTCTDALRLESPEFTKLVSSVHSLTYRYTPKLYAKGYRQEERSAVQWIGRLLTPAAKKLYQMLCKNDYDAVICVHVFAALIVTQMRTLYGEHTPAFFVATDYTCSPFVAKCDMDGFFIPHPLLTDEFHAAGIPKEKLIVTGIPIHQKFEDRRPQQSARAALDLPEKGTIILLASGSIGCGPLKQLYTRLACELPGDSTVVVICGNNRRLKKKLEAIPVRTHSRIIGFTDQISLYMDAANCFVTKAGGISITEALTKGTPTLLLNAVDGCETHNYRFMTEHGFLPGAGTAEEAAERILSGQPFSFPEKADWLDRELLYQAVQHTVEGYTISHEKKEA